ncbi:distal tail protein Dit [Clostridium cuniculi]|uniref:distal tail protein Dit n=1 Tax=Clostridium cuniculi TaxID=2548455 RepID=UPI001054E557|nr:distal tail protein Dit [Clostridium cuniculi]
MHRFFIVFNNRSNLDVKAMVETRPSKPSPEMEYETVRVPGGKTLYREKGYKDIEIPISFNFISKKPSEWGRDFRSIKKWLLSINDNKLKFSDDFDFYYKVNTVKIDTPERLIRKAGKFTAIFTCEPYDYLVEGLEEIILGKSLFNQYEETNPIYLITGEGNLKLNVNGKEVTANIGQNLTINTELGLCYREDGTINNVALKGRYQDLELKEGDNTFSFNEGFDIKIIPNWRCL